MIKHADSTSQKPHGTGAELKHVQHRNGGSQASSPTQLHLTDRLQDPRRNPALRDVCAAPEQALPEQRLFYDYVMVECSAGGTYALLPSAIVPTMLLDHFKGACACFPHRHARCPSIEWKVDCSSYCSASVILS